MSLSARRAWIEILCPLLMFWLFRSLSARRAWIEIARQVCLICRVESLSARRAWIEIGFLAAMPVSVQSLSARRAWIEITMGCLNTATQNVALRKESVDRNRSSNNSGYPASRSLSARRAWIEILLILRPLTTRSCRSPQGERG